MNRRQFLRASVVAGTVAAVCPTALKIADRFRLKGDNTLFLEKNRSMTAIDAHGTVTGRFYGQTSFHEDLIAHLEGGDASTFVPRGYSHRQEGKSFAADVHMLKMLRANPKARIMHVTPEGNRVMTRDDIPELEARTMAYVKGFLDG